MKKFFKHIVSLEETMKKPYMTKMDLKDFKKIKKGSDVLYMGGTHKVIKNDGYVLTLKGEASKPIEVNLGMFNHGGAIHEGKLDEFFPGTLMDMGKKAGDTWQLPLSKKWAAISPSGWRMSYSNHPKGKRNAEMWAKTGKDRFGNDEKRMAKDYVDDYALATEGYNDNRLQDEVHELVRDMPENAYKNLAHEYLHDSEDPSDMENFIYGLTNKEAKKLIKEIEKGIFESKLTFDSNTLSIVDDLTDNEMMDLRKKLKMKQDGKMLTWKSPNGGVDVMITQGGNVRAIFTGEDSKEAKIAMKILKVKKLGVVESINLTERAGSKRDPESIRKEYKDLKKQSISYLRREWSRLFRVGTPNQSDKETLVIDIIRAYHGDRYVDKAFEGIKEAAQPKILKDLEKMDGQIDYLHDADPKTQKIWKKAGFDPNDKDTIILYSYVNHWPPTKKLLDKSKIKYKELEDNDAPGESYIVFNINEKIELVHVYDDGGDLYGTGELVKGKTRKDRGTVYQLVKLDGKNKIWVADHNIKLVEMSSAQDGGEKTSGKGKHEDHVEEDIETMWKKTYGEDLKRHYPGIAKILKQRPGMDRRELKRIWDETYGEDFEQEYPALWSKLN